MSVSDNINTQMAFGRKINSPPEGRKCIRRQTQLKEIPRVMTPPRSLFRQEDSLKEKSKKIMLRTLCIKEENLHLE